MQHCTTRGAGRGASKSQVSKLPGCVASASRLSTGLPTGSSHCHWRLQPRMPCMNGRWQQTLASVGHSKRPPTAAPVLEAPLGTVLPPARARYAQRRFPFQALQFEPGKRWPPLFPIGGCPLPSKLSQSAENCQDTLPGPHSRCCCSAKTTYPKLQWPTSRWQRKAGLSCGVRAQFPAQVYCKEAHGPCGWCSCVVEMFCWPCRVLLRRPALPT